MSFNPTSMRCKGLLVFAAAGWLSMLSSCVSFKTQTLYDGLEPADPSPQISNIQSFVEPEIFQDDLRDVWGLEEDLCKNIQVSNAEAIEGRRSLHLKWNRRPGNCEWAGIGIGWDGYAGKDLSALMDTVAISMQVRAADRKMFGLPIVLTLEDYSGGMGSMSNGKR